MKAESWQSLSSSKQNTFGPNCMSSHRSFRFLCVQRTCENDGHESIVIHWSHFKQNLHVSGNHNEIWLNVKWWKRDSDGSGLVVWQWMKCWAPPHDICPVFLSQVTLIPTHDTEVTREWYQQTHERQQELNIMVLASSSTVVMQDESFPACKIEF